MFIDAQNILLIIIEALVDFSPIWLPFLALLIFWKVWVRYVRAIFNAKQKYILLELKWPVEMLKSPASMELFFEAIAATSGESTVFDRYWEGKSRPFYSVEIVSLGGKVHFYIRIRANMKNIVESALYSQFPNIEMTETVDYSLPVFYDEDRMAMFLAEYKLTQGDPLPIKTYIDYGLDKNPKEEFKVDPLTSVVEYMGSIKAGEQMWLQIIFRGHKPEKKEKFEKRIMYWTDAKNHKTGDWKEKGKALIEEIIKNATPKRKDKEGNEISGVPVLTKGDNEKIEAIQRSLGKVPFDVGIRSCYFAEPAEKFQGPGGILGLFRPFASAYNSFAPNVTTSFDYPWQDIGGWRVRKLIREQLRMYKERAYFLDPDRRTPFILTSEELATIFHFPGAVLNTPTVERILSRKSEPPANLPF